MIYSFDGFELDRGHYELRHEGRPVALEPQVFELISYLVEHPGRLLTKEELLDEVWGTRFVTESALTTRVKQARRALGDDGRSQRVIRTVIGRGYRMTADVVVTREDGDAPDGAQASPGPPLAGRHAEIGILDRLFGEAVGGQRRVVLIGGEPGQGKTTLLEAFLGEATARSPAWVAWGQSVEHAGTGEPYLPLLDALGRLCRAPGAGEVVSVLAQYAPTWVLQLPGLVDDATAERLRTLTLGATRERMLREILDALDAVCARRPLVLVIEDLHWSDQGTREVVAALARRSGPAAMLVAATYRPGGAPDDGVTALVSELAPRRPTCDHMQLGGLDQDAVAELVRARLDATEVPSDLVDLLTQRADRNPLFVTALVDHWLSVGLITVGDGVVRTPGGSDELGRTVPATLHQLIDHQVAQLAPTDRDVVDAAGVVGVTAVAAAVAAALEDDEEAVEGRMADLAQRSGLLSPGETVRWPDGTITSAFTFRHSLYQQVLYDGIPAARRARMHQQVGERLATAFGTHPSVHAADLARHFVQGGDAGRAVPALVAAAEVALRRSGHAEAVDLLEQARSMMPRSADGDERLRWEAQVDATLAPALIATRGWAAPEVREAYERALSLCQRLEDHALLDSVPDGLATLHEYRAEYEQSQELMEQRLRLRDAQPAAVRVEAHELLACSSFHQGGFEEALGHAEAALVSYDAREHLGLMALYGENPAVSSRHWAAHAQWFLGHPDRALRTIEEALALAGDLAHSFSLSHAHEHAAYIHQYRQEPDRVRHHADATVRLAGEQGYAYREATGTMLQGWALAVSGDIGAGLAALARGLDAYRATGAAMDLPYFLALLADVSLRDGRLDDASSALDEARTIPRGRGYFYEPELLRLRGEVLRRQGLAEVAGEAVRRSLEVARALGARSLELRSAMTAVEHAASEHERGAALAALRSARDTFDEGFDTPDLQRAASLLASASPSEP
jgi:DNA-binding winged helix-turn-helix (wHTH) protein/predicted ATPase